MLECDALLNLIKLSANPRVLLVSIRVKSSQRLQTFIWSIVINEPLQEDSAVILEPW